MMWFLLLACNNAPVDWHLTGVAPGARAPWGGPTDDYCSDKANAEQVGDFLLCAADQTAVIPIDDPVMVTCGDPSTRAIPPRETVAFVFDGLEASAYPLGLLDAREGVHDWLHGIPVFVDW